MKMKAEFDQDTSGLYVTLTEAEVARTVEVDNAFVMVNVDLDAEGRAVGVEVLGPRDWAATFFDTVTVGTNSNPTKTKWTRTR